jgi:septal ring factor EnvC (AmiA/AmiB activator)
MQARRPQPRPLQRVSITPPRSLGPVVVLALAAVAVVFLLAELNAMRVGMDSVNEAVAQTNAQLLGTNRQLSSTNRQLTSVASLLRGTNRTLIVMQNQLGGTNSRLGRTNEQLRTIGGNIAPMRAAIDGMTKKIVHAKLLF